MKTCIINNKEYLVPDDFDWRSYVRRHQDLQEAGINTEEKAVIHYIIYGHKENRLYHKYEMPEIDTSESDMDIEKYINFTSSRPINIAISVLFFYPKDKSLNFLKHAPQLFIDELLTINPDNRINFIIRNNSLDYNNHEIISEITKIKQLYHHKKYIKINYEYGYNTGFGGGHNQNLLPLKNLDFILCLNDDLGFLNCHWLKQALYLFNYNKNIGVIGAKQSPHFIQNKFGFGNTRNLYLKPEPDYAEGSILLANGGLFKRLNGFDNQFEYFYFEDVDFCLRARQLGYKIKNINIPHQHFRSDSTQKIPQVIKSSIVEHNRAKFLCKWSDYLGKHGNNMTNKILISLRADGFGDLIDCFYPVQQIIDKHILNHIDIYILNDKVDSLYKIFNKPILHEYPENKNYDTIYNIDNLNLSPPFSTLDMIAAKLGVEDFSTDPSSIKTFINNNIKTQLPIPDNEYVVIHFDSQRTGFEGRMPDQTVFIPTINYLIEKYSSIILIGKKLDENNTKNGDKFEIYIDELKTKQKIIDHREPASIDDIIAIVSRAKLFIGLDSGPSHVAQLLDIPSYIIYGPINPLNKIYRYHNSGCWFNMSNDSLSGSYHKNLYPSYHYDLRRDEECINIKPEELLTSIQQFIENNYQFDWNPIYEKFRLLQRQFLNLQFHNPIYKNRILDGDLSSPSDADLLIRVLNIYEEHAMNVIKKQF